MKFIYSSDNVVTIKMPYGSAIVKPLNPVKQGYAFKGWDSAIPDNMPAEPQEFTAIWEENTDAAYTVKHIKEDLNGNYPARGESVEIVYLNSTTGQDTNAEAKNYIGFTAQNIEQKTIAEDGSTEVEIKYTRNSHSLTWNVNGGEELEDGEYTWGGTKYGTIIIKPEPPTRAGYIFGGWYKDAEMTRKLDDYATMPDTALTLCAKWNKTQDGYTVMHIREDLNGNYPESGDLVETEFLAGITGQSTSATAITYAGFTAQAFDQKEISSDGNTVVEILYSRNSHRLTWDVNGGEELEDGEYTWGGTKYGTTIIKPEPPTRAGYIFGGWYKDSEMTRKLNDYATMPDNALTLYAKWIDVVNIGYIEITEAYVTAIQKKFNDIATVTNNNGTIIIKLCFRHPTLRDAVAWAEQRGALVVSSAGNEGDETVYFPGAFPSVLCVGSVNEKEDGPAIFSNRNSGVDLLAPGSRLAAVNHKGEAVKVNGTSFSTAWATGAAAALLTKDPTQTKFVPMMEATRAHIVAYLYYSR